MKPMIALLSLILFSILVLCSCAGTPAGTTLPGTTVPETTVPETTVPGTTVPITTVPKTTAPETTVPGTTAPETTVPAPEPEPVATVLPVKGGADGVLVLIHDDGTIGSAQRLDEVYAKYNLRGNVAMIANRVWNTSSGTPKSAEVASWQALLDTGRWQITSHSMTHAYWGQDDADGMITEEVVHAQTVLQTVFPSQRVLTFAYPGFSAQKPELGEGRFSALSRQMVLDHYISGRAGTVGGAVALTGADWNYLPARGIGIDNLSSMTAAVDEATAGKFVVLYCHLVCSDATDPIPAQTVNVGYMDTLCAKIAGYVDENRLWSAFYEDAVLYLREAASAEVSSAMDGDTVTVTLTDEEDDEIYNYPLTVRVPVPDGWEYAKVVQGERISYSKVTLIDGVAYADSEIVPDSGDAKLTAIAESDIPAPEPEPEPEPEPKPEATYNFEDGIGNVLYTTSNPTRSDATTTTFTPEGAAGNALRMTKNATGLNDRWTFPIGEEVSADSFTLSFRFCMESASVAPNPTGDDSKTVDQLNHTLFQLSFADSGSPYLGTITLSSGENGYFFGDVISTLGGTKSTMTGTLDFGKWYTASLTVTTGTASEFLAVLTIDGTEVLRSVNFLNQNKTEGAQPGDTVAYLRFTGQQRAQFSFCIDDLSITAQEAE